VRGHLVRRGSKIFWRVPHLRGSARAGVIRKRTVAWIIDASERKRGASGTRYDEMPAPPGVLGPRLS
jgi:hypothetical protein